MIINIVIMGNWEYDMQYLLVSRPPILIFLGRAGGQVFLGFFVKCNTKFC